MLRARTLARLAAGPAGVGLAALTVALALLAAGGPAMAATRAAEPTPPDVGAGVVAAAAAPTKIISKYSCDLSGYGTSTPASLSATLTIPASVVAGSKVDITLATTASDALPTAALTALSGVTTFDVSAHLTQQPGTGVDATSPVPLAGTAQAPATLTAVPAATATGTAEFDLTGTGVIVTPAQTLTITPHTSTNSLAAITCSTTAATQNVKVVVSPETVGTSGPLYACVVSLAGINLDTVDAHIVSTIAATGTRTTGKTDTVTYSTGTFGPWETSGTSGVTIAVSVAADLAVTGAQPGQIAINQSIDPKAAVMKLSGRLALTKAGTDHILVPKKITITLKETADAITLTSLFTCSLTTTPTPAGLTMSVTDAGGSTLGSGTPTPTPTPSPASTQIGVPVGAPDTGGGPGSGVSVGAVAAGGLIVVSGGGLVLVGRRRSARRN